MTGGPAYAAGLELAGASPLSEEERERAERQLEQAGRDAAALIAGAARDADDFFLLASAVDLDTSRGALVKVRAEIRQRRRNRTKGRPA